MQGENTWFSRQHILSLSCYVPTEMRGENVSFFLPWSAERLQFYTFLEISGSIIVSIFCGIFFYLFVPHVFCLICLWDLKRFVAFPVRPFWMVWFTTGGDRTQNQAGWLLPTAIFRACYFHLLFPFLDGKFLVLIQTFYGKSYPLFFRPDHTKCFLYVLFLVCQP